MKFLNIQAENFLSFQKFQYDFPSQGLFFIGGEKTGSRTSNSNGTGKSAFIEALAWSLFGKTVRNVGKDDVVNWSKGKDCAVSIDVVDDHENKYTIARFRKHHSSGNELFLIGEQNMTQSSVTKTQEEIDHILGMNWLVFSTAIMFGEKAKRFSEAADNEKKQIFDEILMLQKYLDAKESVKVDMKSIEELLKDSDQKIEMYERLDDEIDSKIKQYENDLALLAEEHKETSVSLGENKKRVGVLKKELTETEGSLESLQQTCEELERGDEELMDDLEKKENQRNEALVPLEEDNDDKKMEVNVLSSELEKISKSLKSLDNFQIGSRCPTCGHEFSENSVDDVRKHFEKEYKEKQSEHNAAEEELKKSTIVLESEEGVWHKKIQSITSTKIKLEEVLSKSRFDISDMKVKSSELGSEIRSLEFESNQLEKSYEEKKVYVSEQIKIEKTKIKLNAESLDSIKAEIKDSSEELHYLNFWKEGFGNQGIKSLLLDEVVPILNDRVSYYASALLDDAIVVEFDTETTLKSGETRDKFNIKLTIAGEEVDYKNCSSGEKRRIDVSILLALQNLIFARSASSSNLIIFDEVFDSLDRIGIERVINLLEEESKDKTIFVISHIADLQSYFNNCIIVKNTNGVSSLEIQY